MRVFLLDKDYSGESLYPLRKRERQYLEKVLRLEKGTVFSAKDREERWYTATVTGDGMLSLVPTATPEDTLLDSLSSYKGPFAPIDMYVSILKGKKLEGVVRALTEIGVRRIVLVKSEFCQEAELSNHAMERLETIVKEAVQQSGGRTPLLSGPVPFDKAVLSCEGTKIIMHQGKRTATRSVKEIPNPGDINIVLSAFIGPEGGFSDNECLFAEDNGFMPVLLNTNILRSETAAVYTAAVLQSYVQG